MVTVRHMVGIYSGQLMHWHHTQSICRVNLIVKDLSDKMNKLLVSLLIAAVCVASVLGQEVKGSQSECHYRPQEKTACRTKDRISAWTWQNNKCRRLEGCYNWSDRNVHRNKDSCNRICKYSK